MKKQNWKDDFRPEAPFGDSSPLENKIIIYQTEDGQTQVDVRMEDETVNDRLRRDQLSELRQLVQVVGRTLQHRDITDSTDGKPFLMWWWIIPSTITKSD